jgi:hypothetical protein
MGVEFGLDVGALGPGPEFFFFEVGDFGGLEGDALLFHGESAKYATTRVVRSLVDWKCLAQTRRSSYHAVKQYTVDEPGLSLWLYEAVLRGTGLPAMIADRLSGSKSLFPFKLLPLKHLARGDSRLKVAGSGPDGEVVELERTS